MLNTVITILAIFCVYHILRLILTFTVLTYLFVTLSYKYRPGQGLEMANEIKNRTGFGTDLSGAFWQQKCESCLSTYHNK
jgi:hypothetical protein